LYARVTQRLASVGRDGCLALHLCQRLDGVIEECRGQGCRLGGAEADQFQQKALVERLFTIAAAELRPDDQIGEQTSNR